LEKFQNLYNEKENKKNFWPKKRTLNLLKVIKSKPGQTTFPLPRYIKKLSNIELSMNEIDLLSKGLKFIPTPNKQKASDLIRAFNELKRTMNLKCFFHDKTKKKNVFNRNQYGSLLKKKIAPY
jgi:hypothetical protein